MAERRGGNHAPGAIDRTSPIPYYHQLQEILREAIEQGAWQPGDLLPSEAQLSGEYGISRTVIRQALDVLESDGLIYRVKGRGTVVSDPKFRYEAVVVGERWLNEGDLNGLRLGSVLAARRSLAGALIGRLLGIPATAEVFEITIVHEISGVPMALSQSFLRIDASDALASMSANPTMLPAI